MTTEKIWLIDMGDEFTWCDSPEPSDGVEEEDVTEYIRADVVEKMVKAETERCTKVAEYYANKAEEKYASSHCVGLIRDLVVTLRGNNEVHNTSNTDG